MSQPLWRRSPSPSSLLPCLLSKLILCIQCTCEYIHRNCAWLCVREVQALVCLTKEKMDFFLLTVFKLVFNIYLFVYFVYMYWCAGAHVPPCVCVCVCKLKDNFWGRILFPHVYSGNWTDVARLSGKCLYPLSHLACVCVCVCQRRSWFSLLGFLGLLDSVIDVFPYKPPCWPSVIFKYEEKKASVHLTLVIYKGGKCSDLPLYSSFREQ